MFGVRVAVRGRLRKEDAVDGRDISGLESNELPIPGGGGSAGPSLSSKNAKGMRGLEFHSGLFFEAESPRIGDEAGRRLTALGRHMPLSFSRFGGSCRFRRLLVLGRVQL